MDKFAGLRAFVQVVEAGGFAAAARQMGLSRSTVNRLVIELEDALGVQLLQRSTRRVSPTVMGGAFCDRARAILADLAEAEQAVAQLQAEPKGTLRLNAPMSFGTMALAPAIAQFAAQYPDLQIQLTLEDRQIDPIAEGYDLTLRIGEPPSAASLVVQQLAQMPMLLCASPSYLIQRGEPRVPADLKAHACLHYGHFANQSEWLLQGPNSPHRLQVQGRFCANNGEVLRDGAIAGLGIVMLPEFIVSAAIASSQLQPVLRDYPPAPLMLCAIYPANRHLSVKVQRLMQVLGDRFGGDR
ncbi:MAG: LysR family transcriptional regulator [Synechococcales cyanobacterium RM1_1_8]|nr:LysR family transcriptional regulator [Synechococcales cyanobacterium RM1_1_8]